MLSTTSDHLTDGLSSQIGCQLTDGLSSQIGCQLTDGLSSQIGCQLTDGLSSQIGCHLTYRVTLSRFRLIVSSKSFICAEISTVRLSIGKYRIVYISFFKLKISLAWDFHAKISMRNGLSGIKIRGIYNSI